MLTVRDIMNPNVVTVTPAMTVRQLARLLDDEEISGAPVVRADGVLLGVVSASDVVRLAADEADVHVATSAAMSGGSSTSEPDEAEDPNPDPHGYFLPEDSPFVDPQLLERFTETELDSMCVEDIMTPVTFSVGADITVQELADFLVRGHIHRAVVLNHERLVGIVTSSDVLRAVSEGLLV